MPGQAARRYPPTPGERRAVAAEEDEIQLEPHPEGVDAGAVGNQEAGASLLAVEAGEAEQASPGTKRDRDLDSEQPLTRKSLQARTFHKAPRRPRANLSPPESRQGVQPRVQLPPEQGTRLR